jgi:hypothetical protein
VVRFPGSAAPTRGCLPDQVPRSPSSHRDTRTASLRTAGSTRSSMVNYTVIVVEARCRIAAFALAATART